MKNNASKLKSKTIRKIFFKFIRIVSIALSVFILMLLIYCIPWLWRKFNVYPNLEKSRTELHKKYKKPQNYIIQKEFKGVLHSHSYRSHDSRGVIEEILPAAQKSELDFIFLSDHAQSNLDSFPRGYHGIYENVIIESGTEKGGMMVSPFQSIILNWNIPQDSLIKQVVHSGGLVLYVHSEERHAWANPDYQAMEIYNIHTDLIDEESGILPHVINFAINGKKYRHWVMREIFDEQHIILSRWDSINSFKKVVGMAGVDAHNNQNYRARYTPDGQVEWVGPNADRISLVKPGWKEKLLLSEPDIAGWAFKFETDTYFHSFNYVNTHVFCDTLSSRNIKDNLIKGRAFIAFESLANAEGFQFYSENGEQDLNAIMGDSISSVEVQKLKAVSPFPVQFKLKRNGALIDEIHEAYAYEFDLKNKKGNYRIEAFLKLNNKQVPWVYTNPIYIY